MYFLLQEVPDYALFFKYIELGGGSRNKAKDSNFMSVLFFHGDKIITKRVMIQRI